MKKLNIFNSKEIKRFKKSLEEEYGYSLNGNYAYLINEKNKLFLINKSLSEIDTKNLIVDRVGLYFAEYKNNQVRLSKEGAQFLINKNKKNQQKIKNIINLDQKEVKKYFSGEDLNKNLNIKNSFIFLKYKDNILGCAKYKDQTIINFLPKIHRGEVIL